MSSYSSDVMSKFDDNFGLIFYIHKILLLEIVSKKWLHKNKEICKMKRNRFIIENVTIERT